MLIFIHHILLEFILRAKTTYKPIALNYWVSHQKRAFMLPEIVSDHHAILWYNKEQRSVSMSTMNWGSGD